MTEHTKPTTQNSKLSTFSWCLYDWANTAFGTVIITFIYSVYFAKGVIEDETAGAAQWAYAIGISGMLIAVLSPVIGAIADHTGRRKPWIFAFTLLCAAATAGLWFGVPGMSAGGVAFLLLCLIVANVGLEMGTVFYNAMLPGLVSHARMGRLSGFAWAMGYMGGLVCLVVALFGLVGMGDAAPLLPVPEENSMNIRATALLTALWLIVFSLPLLFFTPDEPATGLSMKAAVKEGFVQLKQTVVNLKAEKNLALFLLSSAVYRDGLNTLFTVGGLYAAGRYGMEFEEILIFAIGLNVTAGLGAAAFAYMDDAKGSKATIMMALIGLIGLGVAILLVDDKVTFMVLSLGLGIFMGPAQAASRTLAGRLSPPDQVTQTYGFYAFTGKTISFLGPLCYGLATDIFQTQQAGMASIVVFWTVGAILLMRVREERN